MASAAARLMSSLIRWLVGPSRCSAQPVVSDGDHTTALIADSRHRAVATPAAWSQKPPPLQTSLGCSSAYKSGNFAYGRKQGSIILVSQHSECGSGCYHCAAGKGTVGKCSGSVPHSSNV
jgi:hypothetical protein